MTMAGSMHKPMDREICTLGVFSVCLSNGEQSAELSPRLLVACHCLLCTGVHHLRQENEGQKCVHAQVSASQMILVFLPVEDLN